MFTSLRTRLLLWYTALLALVVVVFGVLVCYLAWRTRLANVDAALRDRADLLAHALQPAAAGTFDFTLPPDPVPDEADGASTAPYHALWTHTGAVIDQSDPERDIPTAVAPGVRTRNGNREVVVRAPSGAIVLTGRSLDGLRSEIATLAATMAGVGAVALALSLAGGWWLTGRALKPIDRISATARSMAEGDLAARIPIERVETELGQLARTLNDAFDGLHASLDRQRRFTADASHELRTPLATISTEAQWALGRNRAVDEYRHSIEVCRRAAARMQSVVEQLLALARAETTTGKLRREPVRLDLVVAAVAGELEPLARARALAMKLTAAAVTVTGDPDRLRNAVTHVVANAIQYNKDHGEVSIRVEGSSDSRARIEVRDTGVGIAPDDLPHVFEPFFRADPARSRDAGGAGLGLAVARAIVRQHGGDVTCASSPGAGTCVTMWLA
jgi:two-component system, OmpR family, sensor kinase